MGTIPTSVTESVFEVQYLPSLSVAERGFVSQFALVDIFNLILYRLHSGCAWSALPRREDGPSWQTAYYHFTKWSRDGSWKRLWEASIVQLGEQLDLTTLNLDGTHTPAKNGGESVAYQPRKRSRTTNLLVMCDSHGYVVAASGLLAGNHHDAFQLDTHLKDCIGSLKRLKLPIQGAFLNADSAFDTKALRRRCFNHKLIPNVAANARNQKTLKRGRKRLFNPMMYKLRFVIERTFAWLDKFRALLTRFDRRDAHFLGAFHLAFALLNLRHRSSPSN